MIGLAITLLVRWRSPELLLSFVRMRPGLWALVMLLYPVLSVYPQSLVYRAFLLHRYQPLFSHAGSLAPWGLVLLSATAFSFMHLIFRNPIAPAMTFFGGILFAWRYQQTGSLAISSLEHALYGCLLFTVGLGQYFYHGRVRLQSLALWGDECHFALARRSSRTERCQIFFRLFFAIIGDAGPPASNPRSP